MNGKKVDWLAAFVGREYNAPHQIVHVAALFIFPIVNATTFSRPFK
jgi:hypothetical protein